LPSEEKRTVLSLLDAFIAKGQIRELLGAWARLSQNSKEATFYFGNWFGN
jgi:hypothetical protein